MTRRRRNREQHQRTESHPGRGVVVEPCSLPVNRFTTPRIEVSEASADVTLDEKRHKVFDARRVVSAEVCFDDGGERVVIDSGGVAAFK